MEQNQSSPTPVAPAAPAPAAVASTPQMPPMTPPPTPASAPTPAPTPQPTPPIPPQAPLPAPRQSSPWPWVIGGCLIVVILIIGAVMFAGWWGMRQVKKGINDQVDRFQPAIEDINKNADRFNKEGEEWQKKSEDFRNNMPDPEDAQKEMMPGGYPDRKL